MCLPTYCLSTGPRMGRDPSLFHSLMDSQSLDQHLAYGRYYNRCLLNEWVWASFKVTVGYGENINYTPNALLQQQGEQKS